jgi:N-acetylmuramoyl-L-alanine amidase
VLSEVQPQTAAGVEGAGFGGCSGMSPGKKILHKVFASVSPVFADMAVALACVASFCLPITFAAGTAPGTIKRQAASAQFAKAEEERAVLNSKPADKRTLVDYKQAVASYRRVTLITPRAPEVPDSLLAIAELYSEMGDRFGRSYYQSAVDSYAFLIHEYPTSRFCQDALLRAAKLQRDQLGDAAAASKSYEDFVKRYPRSPRKREAQEALAELALLRDGETPSSGENPTAALVIASNAREEAPATALVHSGGKKAERAESVAAPRVRRISASIHGDATRVAIDLEDSVQYTSARIADPDRIFFDLHTARLTPEIARGNIKVEGNLLTAVRVSQNQAGVVRIVLDVNGVQDYTASLSNNPAQLLIDLYGGASRKAPVRTAKSKLAQPSPGVENLHENVAATDGDVGAVQETASPHPVNDNATGGSTAGNASPAIVRNVGASGKGARSKSVKATNANAKPELIQPPTAPQPTRDGQSTLTRTLGLKVGRIVIDAGHGGHDTGTIGQTGLMEKDLCLDVALRLGKIIQQKLPGAEVLYTRSDDTFVPLEERTNIANGAKADLFISIHANSSLNHTARGVETYYLHLKGSAEAMEVAARENAASQQSVHDLEDLVKKIARTEKVEESREFAEDIQDSLSKRVQKAGKTARDRGVRKAPFVVLIGADMPSILTEISFLSNPADEQLLKKPEQRQRIAEGLYQGVASYLQSINSVNVNLPTRPAAGRAGTVASLEQSRNQN